MTIKKVLAKSYLGLVLLMLYLPIIFIAIFSFTTAKSLGNWTGFTFQLYENLFTGANSSSVALLSALKNTILIALMASTVSTVLGTLAAIGIYNMRGRAKRTIQFLNNVPMLNPDGVSLSLHGLTQDIPAELRRNLIRANGGSEEFRGRWQANARGVDLNHNYDAAFERTAYQRKVTKHVE